MQSEAGHPVALWARSQTAAAEIEARRENRRYLPGRRLAPGLTVTADVERAVRGAELVVVAVPSATVREVVGRARAGLAAGAIICCASKGLEPDSGLSMDRVIAEEAGGAAVALLSGPSFAVEIASGLPAAVVVASADAATAAKVQACFSSERFRVYTSDDVIGVAIGGALKNVMAIATGLVDGLGLGENARAALITRGLAEIVRLGTAAGAQPTTFAGLAGLGDLVLTCTGTQSRNHALGREIARGRPLGLVEADTPMVAEGVRTVASVLRMAREAGVTMPICEEVAAVLFEGKPVADALASLLAREPRPEEERVPRA
jgi:glycerol-3-phosphate dehydrogenase (NAD(P)+)